MTFLCRYSLIVNEYIFKAYFICMNLDESEAVWKVLDDYICWLEYDLMKSSVFSISPADIKPLWTLGGAVALQQDHGKADSDRKVIGRFAGCWWIFSAVRNVLSRWQGKGQYRNLRRRLLGGWEMTIWFKTHKIHHQKSHLCFLWLLGTLLERKLMTVEK